MIASFRAWYTEGRVFDGETFEDWQALPDDGFLYGAVMSSDHTGRQMGGNDSYFSTEDGIYGHSNDSVEEIERRYPGASVKRGKWTTEDELQWAHDESVACLKAWVS